MRSDENGQMMLLAAIVLLIAFVSLAVMVARVTLVANETTRDTHGAFLREAGAVTQTVEMLLAVSPAPTYTVFQDQVQDLQAYEAQRGFLLSWECNDDGLDSFRLTDGRSVITIALMGQDAAGSDESDNDCAA
ncbi:MAG: hypothetical protein AABY18_08955 [Candidatus Thermoplasmatota archaeon]